MNADEYFDLFQLFRGRGLIEPCGSRETCVPPPVDTDADFLVELYKWGEIDLLMEDHGFTKEGGEGYGGQDSTFGSWRKGDVNLIVTTDPDFAMRHRAATSVCKRLNLLHKPDRVSLFRAVLYGEACK